MKIYYFEKRRVEVENLDGQTIRDYEKHYGRLLKVIIDGHKEIACDYDPRQKDPSEMTRFNR